MHQLPNHSSMFLMPHLDPLFPLVFVKLMLLQNSRKNTLDDLDQPLHLCWHSHITSEHHIIKYTVGISFPTKMFQEIEVL